MIIIKLQGGLGNQLFQYAFARGVSSRQKTDFKLDQNPFHTYYKLHKYSLQHFNVKENPAKNRNMFGFVWFRTQYKIFDVFYRYLRLKSKLLYFYYPEQTFRFDPRVFSKKGTYFDGFWQTEKYFENIRDELRKEITLNKSLSEYSQNILNEINNKNAVSIHVRRADYVTHENFGTCSMDYYKKAIAYMTEHVKFPHFFIFSDDYDWASENFKSIGYPITCVNNTAEKNYEDLMLMANCRHNIIANSSFSWWGAWLNSNRNKIVIAPKIWFSNPAKPIDTKDLIPDTWIKI